MYKSTIFIVIVLFISACSTQKAKPDWYKKPPQNETSIFSTGIAKNKSEAKEIALINMRKVIHNNLDNLFNKNDHELQPIDKIMLQNISQSNLDTSKKVSLAKAEIIKSEHIGDNVFVLMRIYKSDLYEKIKNISDVKFNKFKQERTIHTDKNSINRFLILTDLMKEYSHVASLVQLKKFLSNTSTKSHELHFLKESLDEYKLLKNSINIYILSDINSRIFSSIIRDKLSQIGISTENNLEKSNAMKLLVTSKTDETKEYSFNKSKSTIELTLFNKQNSIVNFKQHTFIGQSRKDFKDAKIHSAINLKHKIERFGLFELLGY